MTPLPLPSRPQYRSWSGHVPFSENASTPLRFVNGVTVEDLTRTFLRDSPRLKAVISGFFPCQADVEDLLQDSFINAKRHLSQFQSRSSLGTWLHRIVVNACLMRLRGAARRREVLMEDPAMLERPVVTEEMTENGLPIDRLASALSLLSTGHRAVIQLRYFEQFSTRETAQLLGVRQQVVKSRLHRACNELRSLLQVESRESSAGGSN